MFLNRFLEDPDKKDSVQNLRVLNMKIFFLLLLTLFNVFLMDQDLTRKKSSVLNPGFFPKYSSPKTRKLCKHVAAILWSGMFCWSWSRWKSSDSGLLLCGLGVLWWQVATILLKFSHILTIYTQIERKNRYTFKKAKLLASVFKTAFFT